MHNLELDSRLCKGVFGKGKEDPELFLQQYKPSVIIDEIQYDAELFAYINFILILTIKKKGVRER